MDLNSSDNNSENSHEWTGLNRVDYHVAVCKLAPPPYAVTTPTLTWTAHDVGTPLAFDVGFADRWILVRQFGYAIITGRLADALARLIGRRRAFEAGCGSGFLAYALKARGVDLIASDEMDIDGNPYRFLVSHCPADVIGDGPLLVERFRPEVLLLSWPNHGTTFASRCAAALEKGSTLIYCGDQRGGCTGDTDFFDLLDRDFELDLPASQALNQQAARYHDMRDRWYVFHKTRNSAQLAQSGLAP